ncbi:MAG: hypothetical protein HY327_05365 [Chloroflexi bacterium]|nr:hypothetical protein [Chloroflexota bacterium]
MNTDKEKSAFVRVHTCTARKCRCPRPNDLVSDGIKQIAAQFESQFREQLRPLRKIGREAEFPVVTRDGRAGDVGAILQRLVDRHGFSPRYDATHLITQSPNHPILIAAQRDGLEVAVEVGRGTIELAFKPCDDLFELQREFEKAVSLVTRVAAEREMFLLGFGIQPRTRPSLELMTPRKHYRALYGAIGAPWLKLTTTAADQTHVDICRAELLDAINYMNLLSAPLIALCANSSVYAGRAGAFVSEREGLLTDLGETRYGMTPRKFESLEDFIRYLCEYKCFVLSGKHNYKKFNQPFFNLLTSQSLHLFDEFLWHEHYVWNSARARVGKSTIEVRPACQQPRDEPFAANALIVGWVESLPQVAAYFAEALGNRAWGTMRAYRRNVLRAGLKAKEPAPRMIAELARIAEKGLQSRGRGEEKFLAPVWERIERQEPPGMRARKIFQRRGMKGLSEEIMIRPEGF